LLSGTAFLLSAGVIAIAAIPGASHQELAREGQQALSPRHDDSGTSDASKRWKAPLAVLDLEQIPKGALGAVLEQAEATGERKSPQPPAGPKLAQTIAVQVHDAHGRPIPHAVVKWYRVDPTVFPSEKSSACDAQGYFESARLADGQYRFRVQAEGYRSSESLAIAIPRSMDQPRQLVLNPARPHD
jgi:hypothetical protein